MLADVLLFADILDVSIAEGQYDEDRLSDSGRRPDSVAYVGCCWLSSVQWEVDAVTAVWFKGTAAKLSWLNSRKNCSSVEP